MDRTLYSGDYTVLDWNHDSVSASDSFNLRKYTPVPARIGTVWMCLVSKPAEYKSSMCFIVHNASDIY
jgi:hypothetical protein